eukprot:9407697-Alexandrium_andersonii.AAC.2
MSAEECTTMPTPRHTRMSSRTHHRSTPTHFFPRENSPRHGPRSSTRRRLQQILPPLGEELPKRQRGREAAQ